MPVSIARSGALGVLFIDAVNLTFHGVCGGASHTLLVLMTLSFVGTLLTSGPCG